MPKEFEFTWTTAAAAVKIVFTHFNIFGDI